jgi:hypothetical protein
MLTLLGKYPESLTNLFISDMRTRIQAEVNTTAYKKLNYLETERGVMWYCTLFYTEDSCNANDGGILATAAEFGLKWGDNRPVPKTVPSLTGVPSPPISNTKPVAVMFPMEDNRLAKSTVSNHIKIIKQSSSDSMSDLEIAGTVFIPIGGIALLMGMYKVGKTFGPAWPWWSFSASQSMQQSML